MIADKIKKYLQNPQGINEEALFLGLPLAQRALEKAMQSWTPSESRLYASAISFACARKCAYRYYGEEGEKKQTSFFLNVSLGSLVEAWVMGMARAAGCNIEPAPKLEFHIDQALKETVVPDGSLMTDRDDCGLCDVWNVEIKKCSRYAFKEYSSGEADLDTWGYETQMALEIEGWRNANVKVAGSIFVFVQAENPVDIGEIILPFNEERHEELISKAISRARKVMNSKTPKDLPRAFSPVPETYRKKETGRMKLPFQCSYCDYKKQCWGVTEPDFKAGRPVWIVEA